MKFWLRFGYGVAFVFVLLSVITLALNLVGPSAKPQIVEAVAEKIPTSSTAPVAGIPTPFQPETPVPTPTMVEPTATKAPLVVDYLLADSIDLAAKAPVALTLQLDDGKLMSTNWAGTVPYSDKDDQGSIFAPSNGVIYSYLGDVLTTWAHSGIRKVDEQYFFATNWDLYVRKSPENKTLSLAEAEEKADSLKGITAYLCQAEPETIAFLSDHDANSQCPGEEIELEVVALAIVPHEKIPEYDEAIVELNSWLVSNYPDAGFEKLNRDNGWLIRFCIGKFSDQVSDGSPWYLYNAGVIGFRIKDGE